MSQKLILASTSPYYRRELLNCLGWRSMWQIRKPMRPYYPAKHPNPLSLRLSEAKARAVANLYPDALIIGGDQVATVDGKFSENPAITRTPSSN